MCVCVCVCLCVSAWVALCMWKPSGGENLISRWLGEKRVPIGEWYIHHHILMCPLRSDLWPLQLWLLPVDRELRMSVSVPVKRNYRFISALCVLCQYYSFRLTVIYDKHNSPSLILSLWLFCWQRAVCTVAYIAMLSSLYHHVKHYCTVSAAFNVVTSFLTVCAIFRPPRPSHC